MSMKTHEEIKVRFFFSRLDPIRPFRCSFQFFFFSFTSARLSYKANTCQVFVLFIKAWLSNRENMVSKCAAQEEESDAASYMG